MKSLILIGMLLGAFSVSAVEIPIGMEIKNLNVQLFPGIYGIKEPSKLCVMKVSKCDYEISNASMFKSGVYAKAIIQVRNKNGFEEIGEASNTDYRYITVNKLELRKGKQAACTDLMARLKYISCSRQDDMETDKQIVSDQLTDL